MHCERHGAARAAGYNHRPGVPVTTSARQSRPRTHPMFGRATGRIEQTRKGTPTMSSTLRTGGHGTPDDVLPDAAKILIAGGFGAGKSTLVSTVSEIVPFHTEEVLTRSSLGVDDLAGVEGKATTTVALDFGRITIHNRLSLFLFGTPGQDRFFFMWDELTAGALCAIVLADTRRLSDCFPAVDYFERCKLPFVVAVNCFEGAPAYPVETVRRALTLQPHVPVTLCDARLRASVKEVLVRAVEHVLRLETERSARTWE